MNTTLFAAIDLETHVVTHVGSKHKRVCDLAFDAMGDNTRYCVIAVDDATILEKFTSAKLHALYESITGEAFKGGRNELLQALCDLLEIAPRYSLSAAKVKVAANHSMLPKRSANELPALHPAPVVPFVSTNPAPVRKRRTAQAVDNTDEIIKHAEEVYATQQDVNVVRKAVIRLAAKRWPKHEDVIGTLDAWQKRYLTSGTLK